MFSKRSTCFKFLLESDIHIPTYSDKIFIPGLAGSFPYRVSTIGDRMFTTAQVHADSHRLLPRHPKDFVLPQFGRRA